MHFQIAVTRLGNFVCSIRTLLVLVSMAFCVALALNTQVRAGDEEFPSELVDFVPYQFNPVFEADGGDTWDRVIRERGTILREGDTYHMWYTGYSERSTRSTWSATGVRERDKLCVRPRRQCKPLDPEALT